MAREDNRRNWWRVLAVGMLLATATACGLRSSALEVAGPTTTRPPTAVVQTTTTVPTTTVPTTTTTMAPTTTTIPIGLERPTACKLRASAQPDIGLSFPRSGDRIPASGTVRAAVLFADFHDAHATLAPEDVLAMISPGVSDYFTAVSYGRMNLVLEPVLEWLTLSRPAWEYVDGLEDVYLHKDQIQEAIDLAQHDGPLPSTDVVVVMNDPDAPIPYGPTFTGRTAEEYLDFGGEHIKNGITSGQDLYYWGYLWLNHEIGHSLGLTDLYRYETQSFEWTGEFSLMGDIGGTAPELFAYERWLLGWLDDNQILCVSEGEHVVSLTAVELGGETTAVIVPRAGSRIVVIESRRPIGLDSALLTPGALVYTVDSSIEAGYGPIIVENGGETIQPGESVSIDGVTVTVLEDRADGYIVGVTISD
ncbi:MAG: hypothetical protein ACC683_06605 [Acidimicrobiia bacterium]